MKPSHTRFALLTNHAACTSSFVPSRQALIAHGHNITTLFSPEHGLDAIGADGHRMADGIDPLTGLPVISLYGDRLAPEPSDLDEVDAVLVDLPDVGCRCYTYLWTHSHVMESCAVVRKRVIILDRPNPVSGRFSLAEGPTLDPRCSSFIGRWNIPLRHSCTMGELAQLWRAERFPMLDLEVIVATRWQRNMFHRDWGSSFIPTSPAIINDECCLLYSGTCLLEATNLSEGRGTPLAFRVAGAPWLNAIAATELCNSLQLPGVIARAITFAPETGLYRGELCNGIMLHGASYEELRPVLAAMMLIYIVRELHPKQFAWAVYPTHVNPSGEHHLDLLLGVKAAQLLFDIPRESFISAMTTLLKVSDWRDRMQSHLLYEEE